MKDFLKMLNAKSTIYEQITDDEIIIPVIAIAATSEQGDQLPQVNYAENPLMGIDVALHLTFVDGRIDWAIIVENDEEDD
jgi:hypothetical protein